MQQTHAHRARPHDDEPIALAKHAIKLLEEHIKRDYGATVLMGAEQEFSAFTDTVNDGKSNPYGMDDMKANAYGGTASIARALYLRDKHFPNSRRVNRTYREQAYNNNWHKFEVVLSHIPANADGSEAPRSPSILARSVEALRSQLKRTDLKHHGISAKVPLGKDGSQSVYFDPSIDNVTNGFNLNISLLDSDGKSMFNKPSGVADPHSGIQGKCMREISAIHDENLYLLGHDTSSIRRWSNRFGFHSPRVPITFQVVPRENKTRGTDSASYLENKIASASSNPYYAVMLNLAGIYSGLNAQETTPQRYSAQDYANLSSTKLKQTFQNGTKLRDVLNQLEPGLGERFYEAVKKCPPGQEKTAQEKAPSSVKAR